MRLPIHLLLAWAASALAFSLTFVTWMFTAVGGEGNPLPRPSRILGTVLAIFGGALVVQIVYGGAVYAVLSRWGGLRLWLVVLAYVIPVALFGWTASDTSADIEGTLRWIGFACLTAVVFWLFAARHVV